MSLTTEDLLAQEEMENGELRAQVTAEQLKAAILRTEVNELRRELAFHSHQYAKDLAAMTKERDESVQAEMENHERIAAAQAQVAALTKERDNYKDIIKDQWAQPELAAAQARVKSLHEALWKAHGLLAKMNIPMISDALDTVDDTAALDARLAQERERCAVECEKYASNTSHQDVATAIREMT